MCMKNVNATMFMCSAVNKADNGALSFNGIFDSIIPVKEDNKYFIDNLNIVLNSTIIFDSRLENSDDYFKLQQEYEFMIWMAHVDSALGVPLLKFDLCLDKTDLHTWCKDFYEFKKILKIPRVSIPKGLGKYAIKLLIRPKSDDLQAGWRTQTIHSLLVGETR